jgi:hypothetical protein
MKSVATYAPSDSRQDYYISKIQFGSKPDLQNLIDFARWLNQSVPSTTFQVVYLAISERLSVSAIRLTLENLLS